jgi:DnaJ-class molecular chaperone
VEGYGDASQWRGAFYERMGFEEAERIIQTQGHKPRQILGVSVESTWREITKAYRRKAMECHPDRMTFTGMTKEQAEETFKLLSAAYSSLAKQYGK